MSATAATGGRQAALGELFSIDVDTELARTFRRSHGSPHHYPVELVRGALARGARVVVVRLRRRRLVIEDDGAAIDDSALSSLAQLLDRSAAAELRQQALFELEQRADAALLALLAPAPSAVDLQTGDRNGSVRLRLRRNRSQLVRRSNPGRGTVIAIARRGDVEQERAVLADYCRFADAEVRIDGVLISRQHTAPDLLAATAIPAWAEVQRCEIALPATGELCRVFRLAHGVVQQRWAGESKQRLVYQVAIECAGELPSDFVARTEAAALDLYTEVAGRYPQLVADGRDRVDELFFRHYRADPRSPLLDQLAVFALHGRDQRLTLAQVRERAAHGLCAVVVDEALDRYDLVDAEVVELTPRQKDFLEHDAGIALPWPLLRPAPPGRWRTRLVALRSRVRRSWRALLFRVGRGHASAPDAAAARLCAAVQEAIASGRFELPQQREQRAVDVVWRQQRGRAPCAVTWQGDRPTLQFNGNHRLVQQAVAAYVRDADNLLFILPALLDGHDGWRG